MTTSADRATTLTRCKPRAEALTALVLGAALTRLLPHPPNVTAVGALALFAGARFASPGRALLVALGAMALSDLLLELTLGIGWHVTLPIVYLTVAATVGLGRALLGRRRGALPVVGASLAASTLFFVVTNLGVWALTDFYPHTPAGLLAAYVAALPFFGHTVLGDLFFSGVLFGAWALLARRRPAWVLRPA